METLAMTLPRTLVTAACLAALAGSASAQLGNPGFELGDADPFADFDYFPNTFADWTNIPDRQFTNPIYQELDLAFVRSGAASCKIFGQFNGSPNASLVTQSIAATPGNQYELDVWSLHSSLDPILGSSAAFVSISFNDGLGGLPLTITSWDVANSASVQDLYQNTVFTATAPAGAVNAVIELGYFQLNNSETGSIYYDDAALTDLGANTGLQNASFDTYVPTPDYQPDACCVPGWETSANNTFVNRTFKQTGNSALLMYGQFNGLDNTSVVWQDLPVSPGELVSASSFAGHLAADALQLDNTTFMSLEFYDGSSNLLEITRLTMLDATSPTDVFIPGEVLATAPPAAATARLQFGFFQSAATVGVPPAQGTGAAYVEDAALDFLGANTGLVNPSFDTFIPGPDFEPDPDAGIPGWSASVPPTAPQYGQSPVSADGDFSAFLFGQFPGDNSVNDTVLFQDLSVAAGEQIQVDAQVYQDPGDPLGPDNSLSVTLQFLDAGSNTLDTAAIVALDAASPQGVFIPVSVSGTAPTGTASARINFVYTQANEGTGAALMDDVLVAVVPPPPCIGDLDGDGDTDVFDFGIFGPAFGSSTGDPNFIAAADFDNNGVIDVFDFGIFGPDFGCPD